MIAHTLLVSATLVLGALTPAKNSDIKTNSSALSSSKTPKIIYITSFPAPTVSIEQSSDDSTAKSNDDSGGERPHLFGMLRGGEQNTLIGRHREEQHQETLEKLPGILQKALIQNLNQSIAPAKAGNGSSAPSSNCWVITGKFVIVDSGSGALQAGIGMGAGQSQVEVHAQVYSVKDTNTPFLVFDSKGASGHMPGAVMTHNPYVAAAKFVMSKKEPEKETKKIAKAIAEEIGKFMKAQGIPTNATSSSSSSSGSTSSKSSR